MKRGRPATKRLFPIKSGPAKNDLNFARTLQDLGIFADAAVRLLDQIELTDVERETLRWQLEGVRSESLDMLARFVAAKQRHFGNMIADATNGKGEL